MNNLTQRIRRSTALAAVLLAVTVLILTCTMVLGVAAEGTGETYTLKLEATLYDEVGDEWPVGIQTELAAGETIDVDALTAALISRYPHLTDSVLSDEGIADLPADGKMPAADLNLSATFEIRPFTVTWIVDGVEIVDSVAYGKVPAFKGSTDKAPDAQYTYTFAGWDTEPVEAYEDATYTARYDTTVNEYTVTWVVDGVTTTETYKYGETPSFKGSTDKAGNAQYTYTFAGWDKTLAAVEGDATYTAEYTETVNEYTVTWVVGGVTTTEAYKYGETPDFGSTPSKPADDTFTYIFKGWDKEITAVTGDVTYTAQFDSVGRKFYVYFYYGHNTVLPTIVEYGQAAVPPTNTDKAPTASTVYTFDGWDVDFSNVTGTLKVYAKYTESVRTYTVTFNYGDGKTETVTVEYGKGATAPTDTDKAATEEYTYTFKGWDTDFSEVSSDLIVNAQYEQTPVKEPETDEPDTDEPETNGPDTDEPDTNEPETPAESDSETDPDTDEPDVTDPETTAPGTEPETDPVTGDNGCGGNWWWIVLVIVVAAGVVVAVIILLRRKGEPETDEPETAPVAEPESTEEPEAPAESAPLFIPVGEEVPEEEIPEEVETVEEVAATDVDSMMTDKAAAAFLVASDEEGGQGKMGIINVGLISAAYQAGETVDLASLQAKGMIDGNVGRLKVLASGTLDKPLIIKADAFSVQAIKMITLTGGQAIELKSE